MDETIDIASKLGASIANNERYKAFREAEELLKNDNEAKELSEALEKQTLKIQGLEKDQKPVEVEDKDKLQQLRENVASNQSVQKFLKAQTDYVELMTKVNERIEVAIKPKS